MDKIDFKILIAIAVVLMAWGLFGVYQFASQYRQPLDAEPTDIKTPQASYPDQFTCEGHQCDKL